MAAEALYDVDTGIDTTRITELSRMIEEYSDIPNPPNKSVVGRNAFSHESGIHAAGVIENTDTFEPGVMTPEMVGATREFVLGKHTGTHSVRKRLEEIGYAPTDSEVRSVTRLVKDYGADKQRVTMADLRRFAREENVTREEEVRA
jgi:2-isopropylmalate synthase